MDTAAADPLTGFGGTLCHMTDALTTALRALEERNRSCTACALRSGCLQVVVSDGPGTAQLVIIGEAPGGEDDREGRPFSGPSGQLLNRILEAAGLSREEAYLTNIVKCRPPAGRSPLPEEIQICTAGWLSAQLALLRPQVILTLGNTATQHLLGTAQGITKLRGRWFPYASRLQGGESHHAWLMPMLHPAYLLRVDTRVPNGPKSLTWRDIQEVAAVLRGQKTPEAHRKTEAEPPRLF